MPKKPGLKRRLDLDAVRECFRTDGNRSELARKYGVHSSHVTQTMKRHFPDEYEAYRSKHREELPYYTDEDRDLVCQEWLESGETVSKFCLMHEFETKYPSIQALYRWIAKRGMSPYVSQIQTVRYMELLETEKKWLAGELPPPAKLQDEETHKPQS